MPRTGRIILAHCPHHVVQRGHNRRAVFVDEGDYRYYLASLREWKSRLGVKLYAYCLMTNHVHLVFDPGDDTESIALLMKRLAARQTRYVNRQEGRSGTLWDGRFRSTPVETEAYLLACCRYVELNPVRARLVCRPEEYSWSSYRQKIGIERDTWLDFDPCYRTLGRSAEERHAAYAAWIGRGVTTKEADLIRSALQRGQLTGTGRFVEEVAARTGKRIELRGRGRPRARDPLAPPAKGKK